MHPWHDVSPGNELPRDFQALIEIPLGSNIKYELDKPTGLLKVDRVFILPFSTLQITVSFRKPMRKITILSTCWCFARNRSTAGIDQSACHRGNDDDRLRSGRR